MTDYTRVTFREPIQSLNGNRFVQSSEFVELRKARDERRMGEGVEIVRTDAVGGQVVEFISIHLVSSIVFAPVKGTAKEGK